MFLEAVRNGEANGRLFTSAVSLRGNRIPQDRIAKRRKQAESVCSPKEGKSLRSCSALRLFVESSETACGVHSTVFVSVRTRN